MPDRFVNARARLFNRPLLVEPSRGRQIVEAIGARLGIGRVRWVDGADSVTVDLSADMSSFLDPQRGGDRRRPYDVVDGVGIVEVQGTLVHKLGSLRPYCGMTGYDGIAAQLDAVAADPEVRTIALDIDSCGGEVAGCFDLVDRIYAYRTSPGAKPVVAILTEDAFSAAYAIASAAEVITVPRTGGVGSVGVVAMHVDYSRMLDTAGITVTLVHAGARKVDGNPTEPLADDARARLQADVDALAGLFHRTVARNRAHAVPDLAADAVAALEAGCFLGVTGEAVSTGLADLVLSPDEALARLIGDRAAA